MSEQTFVEDRADHQRTPYLFNGKELDKETGLYYYGARYYDPRISMFLGVDPLAKAKKDFKIAFNMDDENIYGYYYLALVYKKERDLKKFYDNYEKAKNNGLQSELYLKE